MCSIYLYHNDAQGGWGQNLNPNIAKDQKEAKKNRHFYIRHHGMPDHGLSCLATVVARQERPRSGILLKFPYDHSCLATSFLMRKRLCLLCLGSCSRALSCAKCEADEQLVPCRMNTIPLRQRVRGWEVCAKQGKFL